MKKKIRPLGNRILVKKTEEKEQVKCGIIIPDSAREISQQAEVIAVGSGSRNKEGKLIELEVKVGDHVLVSKYGGTEFKVEDETYFIFKEDDILAIFG